MKLQVEYDSNCVKKRDAKTKKWTEKHPQMHTAVFSGDAVLPDSPAMTSWL